MKIEYVREEVEELSVTSKGHAERKKITKSGVFSDKR